MIYVLKVITYFFIGSFCGWIVDTALRSVRRKRWAPIRKIPLAPAYGLCTLLFLALPQSLHDASGWVQAAFFGVSFSILEYTFGAVILKLTGKRIWDYRERHFNLHGHADAWHTVVWSVVGWAALTFVHPPVVRALSLEEGMPPGWVTAWGLPTVILLGTGITATVMGIYKRPKWAGIFLALYVPQGAVVAWMGQTLLESLGTAGLAAAIFLGVAYTVVMVHRVTTYVFVLTPKPWHIFYIAPMHAFQGAMFAWLALWPLSRLLPATAFVDGMAFALPLAVIVVAMLFTYGPPRALDVPLALPGLEGLRVLHLSDIHVGPYMGPRRLADLARRCNALKPDMIALTGDLLTLRYEANLSVLLDFLDALDHPPMGIYASSGNHDLAVWRTLADEMTARGIVVLEDEATVVEHAGGQLQLVGLHYRWYSPDRGEQYAEVFRRLRREDLPVLLLCHDPQVFPRLDDGWRGVMLAGHYHGGQIGLTSVGIEVSVMRPFVYDQGVFQRGTAWLYAHRGTGTYGFPARIGVPAEIAVLSFG